MAKITPVALASAINTYMDAAKIANSSYIPSTNNFVGLLDKIGKVVMLDGGFNDKLPELDGEELPLGKTIEEYFIDLTLPTVYTNMTTEGAKDLTPALPEVEDVVYSYTLGRQKIKTTVPYDNFERAMLSTTDAANFGAKIMQRLNDSYDLTKYQAKKQLIGRAGDKAVTANLVTTIAQPTDTASGEAFIKAVKACVEDAGFANTNALSGALVGAAPGLTLYIKKGIIPSLEVDTYAGAFNKGDIAIPCKIKVVDDFGTQTDANVYAVLVDDRALRLHNGYNALRSNGINADGDFVNFVKHFELTAFMSKYAYIHAFKKAN